MVTYFNVCILDTQPSPFKASLLLHASRALSTHQLHQKSEKYLLSRSHVPSTSLEEVLEPQEAGDSQTGPSSSRETFLDCLSSQNVKKDLLVQASLCLAAGKASYVKPRALIHNYLPAIQGPLDE